MGNPRGIQGMGGLIGGILEEALWGSVGGLRGMSGHIDDPDDMDVNKQTNNTLNTNERTLKLH